MELSELCGRYNVSLRSLRARLAVVGVNERDVDKEAIKKLDAVNDHLQSGQSLTSFSYSPVTELEVVEPSAIVATGPKYAEETAAPAVTGFNQLVQVLEFLEQANEKGWHLPTSTIKDLLGAAPRGLSWTRYGFEFIPATKHGGERAWAIRKAHWDLPL